MAQNFRRYTENNIGTSAVDMPDGSDFNSYDAIVGIRLANITTAAITAEVYINDGSNDIHLIKDVPIAQGGSIELIDGGAKIVVQSGDRLYIKSSVSAGIDAWVSVVDAIST